MILPYGIACAIEISFINFYKNLSNDSKDILKNFFNRLNKVILKIT